MSHAKALAAADPHQLIQCEALRQQGRQGSHEGLRGVTAAHRPCERTLARLMPRLALSRCRCCHRCPVTDLAGAVGPDHHHGADGTLDAAQHSQPLLLHLQLRMVCHGLHQTHWAGTAQRLLAEDDADEAEDQQKQCVFHGCDREGAGERGAQ